MNQEQMGAARTGELVPRWGAIHRDSMTTASRWLAASLLFCTTVMVWISRDPDTGRIDDWELIALYGGLMGLVVLLWLGQQYAMRRVRLILDEEGIAFRNTLPVFSRLRPSWSIRWDELEHVEYQGTRDKKGADDELAAVNAVILNGSGQVQRLRPYAWQSRDARLDDIGLRFSELWRSPTRVQVELKLRQRALQSPIVLALADAGWPPAYRPEKAAALSAKLATIGDSHDITSDPPLMAFAGGSLGLLIYFLVDGFMIGPWRYASSAPFDVFLMSGILAACVAFALSRRSPALERTAIAVFFGACLGAAMWAGALRVSPELGMEVDEIVVYEATGSGEYRPRTGNYPDLRFNDFADYWEEEAHSEYRFRLVRGHLGFWQLDYDRVREEMRSHFDTRRSESKD